jgi:sugar phosphate isomerase/epimerase
MDDVKRLADEYNRIAAVTKQAGLVQGLHTEGFELSTVDGRKTYDVLMDLLDPNLVKFQFQVSTVSQGYDPVDYFTRYPGRFVSMHLQDVDMNAPAPPPAPAGQAGQGRGGRGRGSARRAIGQGTLDWKQIFTAAKTGGVQNYFVEMDFELAKASVPFLRELTV